MKMSELKPCPFCGSDDVGIAYRMPEFGEQVKYFVVCNKCGSRTANFRSTRTAVNVWEARVEDGK